MKQSISEIVGYASFASGGAGAVYRALRPLLCSACGLTIKEGNLFTRWKLAGQPLPISPRCEACAPFILQANESQSPSLLRALLSPGEAGITSKISPGKSDGKKAEEQDKITDAIQQRIGPALARSRRSRNRSE